MTDTATPEYAHPFERSGLGPAPFRFVGHERRVHADYPGAPAQPGSTCDHCGTAIAECFFVTAADGQTSKVGCECIRKLDKRECVVTDALRAKRASDRERRHAREQKQIDHGKWLLAVARRRRSPSLDEPHPDPYHADRGLTRADWCDWMFANAGNAGKLIVCRWLKGAAV